GLALTLPAMMSATAGNVGPFTTLPCRLPTEAEAQKIRPAQRTEVPVRIVEADLPSAAAVIDPAADREAVGGEAGRVVLRREACRRRVRGEVIGRLDGIAPPGGQRESAVPQIRHRILEAATGGRLVVARLAELRQ